MAEDTKENNQLVKAKSSSLQKRASNIISRGLSDLALLDGERAKIADDQFGNERHIKIIDKTRDITVKESFVDRMVVASTYHNHILIFTNNGIVYSLDAYDITQVDSAVKSKAIVNLLNLSYGEKITAFLPVREFTEGKFIVMVTKHGMIKKTDLMAFANVPAGMTVRSMYEDYELTAIGIDEGDELIATRLTDGSKEIFLGTKEGQSIRFNESQMRDMGRIARGVRAITLGKSDVVVAAEVIEEGKAILTMTEKGYGKRTEIEEYQSQLRGRMGIINIKVTEKTGYVVGITQVTNKDELMITTSVGKIIRIAIKDVPIIDRNMHGVKLIDVEKGEWVTDISL